MISPELTATRRKLSSLEMTAADHRRIGSTPPEILIRNPGKTPADLMSEAEISDWLKKKHEAISLYSSDALLTSSFAQSALDETLQDLMLTEEYLIRINRLPEDYIGLEM